VYDNPDGTVRDVVFPVASEDTITNLVKEFRSNEPQYRVRVHTKMRASYSSHYRKMLPRIFDKRREDYYGMLNLPSNAAEFISDLKSKMTEALIGLNANLPKNLKIRIKHRGDKPHISITPYDALPEPPNLDKLKQELNRRWPATSLLDVLKETDLRVGFTQGRRAFWHERPWPGPCG
jgi:hypothetical protein